MINKNEIIEKENENLEQELKKIKEEIEFIHNDENYKKYLIEKKEKDENDKKIMKLDIEENEYNKIMNDLINKINTINSKKINLENNKKIEEESLVIKIDVEELYEEIKYLELNNYKEEQEIENNKKIIEKYNENKLKYKEVYDDYRIYKNYMELLHKNGLALHILKRYLGLIAHGINVVTEQFIKKKIELNVEKEDIVLRINVLSKEDNENYNIIMLGGKESLILDVGFKIVMSSIATLPRSNIMWIDEGVSVLDRESQSNMKELLNYLSDSYENVLLISHIEGMKDFVNKSIKITREEGGSKIECE